MLYATADARDYYFSATAAAAVAATGGLNACVSKPLKSHTCALISVFANIAAATLDTFISVAHFVVSLKPIDNYALLHHVVVQQLYYS
jgi:uncharacterized membrane protein